MQRCEIGRAWTSAKFNGPFPSTVSKNSELVRYQCSLACFILANTSLAFSLHSSTGIDYKSFIHLYIKIQALANCCFHSNLKWLNRSFSYGGYISITTDFRNLPVVQNCLALGYKISKQVHMQTCSHVSNPGRLNILGYPLTSSLNYFVHKLMLFRTSRISKSQFHR